MNTQQIVAIILIIIGVLGLAYGSFTYIKSTHTTSLGPLEVSVKDKETVVIPIWAGVGAIIGGGLLLFFAGKKR